MARFVIFLTAILLFTAGESSAQRCIGSTRYLVRDEAGKIIAGADLKNLTVKRVNGIPIKLRPTPSETGEFFYEGEFVRGYYQNNIAQEFRRETRTVLHQSNPLTFAVYLPTDCGKVGDLTLEYRGIEMRLIFDIPEHNSSFLIDSLPFQAGTFYRNAMQCADGVPPPLIDNNTTGKCLVSADTWKKADVNWTRPVRWSESWTSNRTSSCSDRKIQIIANHTDWTKAWKMHRGLDNYNPLPAIDFQTEAVLIAHLPRSLPLEYDLARVNMNGDLSFSSATPVKRMASDGCAIWLLRIYRSGIKTIDGKRLPAS